MLHKTIDITVDYTKAGLKIKNAHPTLTLYGWDNIGTPDPDRLRPAIVICPGGGYAGLAAHEDEPIALAFMKQGFQCFVLHYTCAPELEFPAALLELAQAVATVRANAKAWHVREDRIFTCGFSAGGHLAASLAVFWNRDFIKNPLGLQNGETRIAGAILCYPVITSKEPYAHLGSFVNLLKDKYNKDMLQFVSLEDQVDSDTPPCFFWHTCEDTAVPMENSLMMAQALRKKNTRFSLHVFPHGEHGLALANHEAGVSQAESAVWVDLATEWILNMD